MTTAGAEALKAARGRRRGVPLPSFDVVLAVGAALLTVLTAGASVAIGAKIGFGLVLVLTFFIVSVLGFLVAPHVTVALMIPLFAFVPAAKVFVSPSIGPIKDVVTFAAIVATLVILAFTPATARASGLRDRWVLLAVGLLLGLYVLNAAGGHGVAWFQGVRLTSEPLLLLIAGMTLPEPRRTLRWAVAALIATACAVAFYGLVQQVVGKWTLVGWGYSFSSQVRSYNGHLRSFGTLDDPFAYAAFLLSSVAAIFFYTRRGVLAAACSALIIFGLAASFVRTAALITVALAGLWLARKGFATTSILTTTAAVLAMGSILVTGAGGTQTQSYRSATSNLTLNGRTSAWKTALGPPSGWLFGRGVGKVGTAAYRAGFKVTPGPNAPASVNAQAVDSGYLATIADVGLAGTAVLLGLLGRLIVLAWRGARRGFRSSWLALALITVLMLDAVTRSSFTGFPTAFLGYLLIGLCLAATAAAEQDVPRPRILRPVSRSFG